MDGTDFDQNFGALEPRLSVVTSVASANLSRADRLHQSILQKFFPRGLAKTGILD